MKQGYLPVHKRSGFPLSPFLADGSYVPSMEEEEDGGEGGDVQSLEGDSLASVDHRVAEDGVFRKGRLLVCNETVLEGGREEGGREGGREGGKKMEERREEEGY